MPAVIVSAILNALEPLGVRDITMPATNAEIWQAIHNAKKGQDRGGSALSQAELNTAELSTAK